MVRESTAREIVDLESNEALLVPELGGGLPPTTEPLVSNARLGLSMLLAAEVMFFAGLIGAFLVFRLSAAIWPPPFQPRLPTAVTAINTLVLLLSAVTMLWAIRAMREGSSTGLRRWLSTTAALGTIFLAVQGYEWIRLVRFGLTLSSGVYGATFYTLIGCHALHVLGAVAWLIFVGVQARQASFGKRSHTGVELCGMYWTFVVALWPVLYGLVYLY